MNTINSPVTLYKGTKLALFTPQNQLCILLPNNEMRSTSTSNSINNQSQFQPAVSHLSPDKRNQLLQLLDDFQHLFKGTFGRTTAVKHTITTEAAPIRQRMRQLPVKLKSVVEQEVKAMLHDNVIQPSTNPWASPIMLVKKHDDTWRFCVDYRRLNAVTHKDAYPLPCIDKTLDHLAKAKYFSTLDLQSGYWEVQVADPEKEKNSFQYTAGSV